MSTDYKTIRVRPDDYEDLLRLRDQLSARSTAALPPGALDARYGVTLGGVIHAALAALRRESGLDEKTSPSKDKKT